MKVLPTAALFALACPFFATAQTSPAQESRVIYQSAKQNGSGCSTQGMSSVSKAEADKNAERAFTTGSFQNATGTGTRFCLPKPAPAPAAAGRLK